MTFVTLDGVMQAPAEPEEDFSGDFKHGGWARPYWAEVMAQVGEEAMAEPYDLLLGRRTYEIFAPHFSEIGDGDAEAAMMNNATKYVATNTLEKLTWKNAVRITGDVPAEVARLNEQDGPLPQVHGSWRLIQTLLDHDLVDEFRLWTFPVVLGAGKRLFQELGVRKTLVRIKSGTTPSGVVMGIYRRGAAGPVDTFSP